MHQFVLRWIANFGLLRTAAAWVVVCLFVSLNFSVIAVSMAQGQESRDRTTRDEVPTIFDVRKSLPMEPTEKAYHDFYINAGTEAGFKRGQYLPIRRAMPIHDPIQNKQQAILTVPVGSLLVIHVDRGLTVARLVQELGNEDRPTLEFEAIMIGDLVDMKGISLNPPKAASKKRTTQAPTTVEQAVESTALAEEGNVPSSQATTPKSSERPSDAPSRDASNNSTQGASVELRPAAPSTVPSGASPKTALNAVESLPASTNSDSGGVKNQGAQPKDGSQRVTQPLPPPTA